MSKNTGRLKIYLLPICFLGLLFVHFTDQLMDFTDDGTNTENREMVSFPALRLDYLDPFPKDFQAYYNDHFKWRNPLISIYSKYNLNIMEKSPIPDKLVLGKERWLFRKEGNDIYRGSTQFSPAELESIRKELEFRKNYVESKGAKYYFVIAPLKQNIYPEFLPDYLNKVNPLTQTENLLNYLEQQSTLDIINLKDSLFSAKLKTDKPLFYKTDNHWNAYGAFLASEYLLSHLRKDFPNLKPLDQKDYEIDWEDSYGRILAAWLKMQDDFRELIPTVTYSGKERILKVEKPYRQPHKFSDEKEFCISYSSTDSLAPSMMMVRESFGREVIPVFSKYFSESIYIFDAWQHKLNKDIFDKEKPDIYIHMVYEYVLPSLLKNGKVDAM
jgi:hypothetical protein